MPQNYSTNVPKSSDPPNYWLKDYSPQTLFETPLKDSSGHTLFSKLPYWDTKIKVKFYQNSIHTSGLSHNNTDFLPPDRKKNDIQSFSVNSRRRLIKLSSMIRFFDYDSVWFTTLTYHEDYPTEPIKFKYDLHRYIKKIKHKYTDVDYIWRLEEQQRGAPHYHLMFFKKNKLSLKQKSDLQKELKDFWMSIKKCQCQYCKEYAVKTYPIDSTSKLIGYISKYSAKVDTNKTEALVGRRWGYSDTLSIETEKEVYFSRPAYRFFYHALLNFIWDLGRDTKYLRQFSTHDSDFFIFVRSKDFWNYLKKYSHRFTIYYKDDTTYVHLAPYELSP